MGARELYDFYISKGLSPAQAAGIAGNAFAESNYNPQAFNPAGGGQGAFGAFQWRADRQTGLRNFAKERGGEATDLMTQAEYAWHEMQNKESAALNALMTATNPAQAAEIFRRTFERPGDDPSGYRRASAEAQRIAQEFAGITPQPGERQLSFGSAAPSRSEQGMAVFDPSQANPNVPLSFGQPVPSAPEIFDMFKPDPQNLMGMMGEAYGGPQPQTPGVFALPELPGPAPVSGAPGISPPTPDTMPSVQSSPTMGEGDMLSFGLPSAAPNVGQPNLSFPSLMDDATVVETTRAAESQGVVPQGTTQSIVDEPEDSEDEAAAKAERRKMIGVMLMQLSKGLGQMSVGQAVDITGVPLAYEELGLQEQRLGLERQQEDRLMRQALLDAQGDDPSGAVNLFNAAGFSDLAAAATQGAPLNELFSEYSARTKDMRSPTAGGALEPTAAIQNAQAFMDSYNASRPPEERITLDQAMNMTGTGGSQGTPPAAIRQGNEWYEANPEYYDAKGSAVGLDGRTFAQQEAAKIASPGGPQIDPYDQKLAEASVGYTFERLAELEANAQAAQSTEATLNNVLMLNDQQLTSQEQTGALTPYLAPIASGINQINFLDPEFRKSLGGLLGISDVARLDGLTTAQLQLAYAVAQANKGQGSVTQTEREQMLKQVPNLIQTNEGRQVLAEQMKIYAQVDQLVADKFNSYVFEEGMKGPAAEKRVRREIRSFITKISTLPQKRMDHRSSEEGKALSSAIASGTASQEQINEYAKARLPNLTRAEAEQYRELLSDPYFDNEFFNVDTGEYERL